MLTEKLRQYTDAHIPLPNRLDAGQHTVKCSGKECAAGSVLRAQENECVQLFQVEMTEQVLPCVIRTPEYAQEKTPAAVPELPGNQGTGTVFVCDEQTVA